jgi:hypothetical protein
MTVLSAWANFFVAEVGASAALAGLLFVALSINVERIIKYPWLVNRAAITLILLLGSLVDSAIALWPASPQVVGVGMLAMSVAACVAIPFLTFVGPKGNQKDAVRLSRALFYLVASLLPLGGSIALLVSGSSGAIYAVAVGALLAILLACVNSWVLLVEVLR